MAGDEFKLMIGSITIYCSADTTDEQATVMYQELDEYMQNVVEEMQKRFSRLRIEGSF